MTLGTLVAVGWRAEVGQGLSVADWAAVRFTIVQALVSAAISVALAVPVARALARRRFPGRALLVTLLGAPFLLPVIVAILGLLAVFGRSGLLNSALGGLGLPQVSIYGFHGVVLAHVFFNLPLATRLILQGWLAVPAEHFRLAATLNGSVPRLIEWPMLRRIVPGALLVIFLICLTSFAIALTLGGGPKATTVELAIYHALRLDFDLGRAALLASLQYAMCCIAALLAWRVTLTGAFGAGLDRVVTRWDALSHWDVFWLISTTVFLLVPLAMVVGRGLPGLADLPSAVWPAALRSVIVAVCAAAISVSLALILALHGGRLVAVTGVLPLATSGMVMGTGLFLMIYPYVSVTSAALPMTCLVNAILALPFALRVIGPEVEALQERYGRLADSLGLRGWARLRLLVLPRLRRPLGFATGLAAALSMGDLGVIALFANDDEATLPLVMYRLMGNYRMEAAAGTGLLLVTISLALFWICDRGGRIDVDA
jgi:thiamine transport system permease protein